LKEANPAWATVRECGFFPCTGPKNVVLDFFGINFKGEKGTSG